MIPVFPKFNKIEINDQIEVEKFTRNFDPYSDFNFVSLWSWDVSRKMALSQLNGNLVIRFRYYTDENDEFFSFIGDNDVAKTATLLLEESKNQGRQASIKLVPEACVEQIQTTPYIHVEEDRDNFDYILSVNSHIEMSGKRFEDNRRLVRRFTETLGDGLVTKLIDLTDHKYRTQVLNFIHFWGDVRSKSKEEILNEYKATERLIEHVGRFNVRAIGVCAGETLIGFAIMEFLNNKYGIIHFEKVDTRYKGLSQYIKQQEAIYLGLGGVQFVNYEQDMGIEGLRKSKMMLQPVKFLKKYTLHLK